MLLECHVNRGINFVWRRPCVHYAPQSPRPLLAVSGGPFIDMNRAAVALITAIITSYIRGHCLRLDGTAMPEEGGEYQREKRAPSDGQTKPLAASLRGYAPLTAARDVPHDTVWFQLDFCRSGHIPRCDTFHFYKPFNINGFMTQCAPQKTVQKVQSSVKTNV